MNRIRQASLIAAAACALLGGASAAFADAPGDAWAAAKGILPASPTVLVGLNVSTIKNSQLFQQLYPQLLEKSGEAKAGLDLVKSTCNIDIKDAVQGIVIAMDETQKGVILVSVKGVDQAKVLDCMNKAAVKDKKTITAGKPDASGIVEYTSTGEKDKLYLAFLPRGVIAVTTEPTDKAMLQKWLTGKGIDGKSPAGTVLGKVNTGAALWGVYGKTQQLEPGMNMKAFYGHADIATGIISADGRVVLGSAKEATDAAAKGNTQLEEAKKGGGIPPAMQSVIKNLRIASAGDELQIKASMPEKEALSLITMAMGGSGGGGQ